MTRQKKATLFLMLGMFFNPFGFDLIQIFLMKITGSYYNTEIVLYCLTVSCFLIHFFYSGKNPIIEVKNIILNILNNRIKKTPKY